MNDRWVEHPETWRRRRERLRRVDQYELTDAVLQGRAVRDPALAPLVLLEAARHRRLGTVAGLVLVVVVAVPLTVGLRATGGVALPWAGVAGAAAGVLVGAGVAGLARSRASRAVARNAAVLEGRPPARADREVAGGSRVLRALGAWLLALFVVSFMLRVSFGLAAALLTAAGVEIGGAVAAAGVVLYVAILVPATWRLQGDIRRYWERGGVSVAADDRGGARPALLTAALVLPAFLVIAWLVTGELSPPVLGRVLLASLAAGVSAQAAAQARRAYARRSGDRLRGG